MIESEYDWRARNDADILRQAEKIKADSQRASAAAKSIQNDLDASKAALKSSGAEIDPNAKGKVTIVNGIPQFG